MTSPYRTKNPGYMNSAYINEPDPAADLWPEENRAWDAYRGRSDAPEEVKAAWRKIINHIEAVRAEVGWPRLATPQEEKQT